MKLVSAAPASFLSVAWALHDSSATALVSATAENITARARLLIRILHFSLRHATESYPKAQLLASGANPNPAPPGTPPPAGTAAPPPGTTGDEEAISDEATVIEVTVIHEVPVIEVTVIELPTSKSGATVEAATGKTTHIATHATKMTPSIPRALNPPI
jgi:hypothetical protein